MRYYAGAVSPWVQRVHLHPLRSSNGCNAPVLKGAKMEDELIFVLNRDFNVIEAANLSNKWNIIIILLSSMCKMWFNESRLSP